ncbi:MAG: hypothetical protein CMC70_10075 [Flavobacteriaceae bacterium]|nr:hypothetical protein [Flavobacteriaceae bacterium]
MKKLLLLTIVLFGFHTIAQVTLIPDENFENYLITEGIDSDGTINGQILTSDVVIVTEVDVSGTNVSDLTGLEDFVNLEVLECPTCINLDALNITNNTALRILNIPFCSLSSIDISNNKQLEYVDISHNYLTSLDFSNHPALTTLKCGNPMKDIEPFNSIHTLNLSGTPNLLQLDTAFMPSLSSIDFSNIPLLEYFHGRYCGFTTLDFSNNIDLTFLYIGGAENTAFSGYSNNLSELDLSNNSNLKELDVGFTGISSLNLKNGTNTLLTEMRANLNENLFCIQVDDGTAAHNGDAPYNNWIVDPQISYSENCVLGIAENELKNFSMYPNPASQQIQIDVPNDLTPKEVKIYSVEGQLLLQSSFNNTIDISTLASGFYILKARFDSGSVNKSFVKQ